jgi:hypothetical protein
MKKFGTVFRQIAQITTGMRAPRPAKTAIYQRLHPPGRSLKRVLYLSSLIDVRFQLRPPAGGSVQKTNMSLNDGVAKSRRQRSYRAFPGARNTTCMPSHPEKHDALYVAIFA